jgi:crossover junction endodeoxyribonuclease RuvC
MRIIGIDPGIATVGFGIVDRIQGKVKPVQYGAIETPAHTDAGLRLQMVYDSVMGLVDKYKPDQMAVEKLFFNRNVTTAFSVSQARGVIILAGVQKGLIIGEYTPLQVKQAVVGYGKAEKKQVQEMVRMLLNLKTVPKPDDVADALAVAICHAHTYTLSDRIKESIRS